MSAKWYLAVGQKKVGPVEESEVLSRISAGKLSGKALAWCDGMSNWSPLGEIDAFRGALATAPAAQTDALEVEPVAAKPASTEAPKAETKRSAEPKPDPKPEAKPEAKKPEPKPKAEPAEAKAPSKGGLKSLIFPESLALKFEQPYQVSGWRDVMPAFGMGMAWPRVKIALICSALAAAVGGVFMGLAMGALTVIGGTAGMIIAAPFALVAAIGLYVITCLSLGAMSYATKLQISEGRVPEAKEALLFAKSHLAALTLTPLALFGLLLLAAILLGILTGLSAIPYVGPILIGLIYIVNIVLGAVIFILYLALTMAAAIGPVVVAFEETGVGDTIRILVDFVRRSMVRFVLSSILPSLAMYVFVILVLAVGSIILGIPGSGYLAATVGNGTSGGEIGAILAGFWNSVFVMGLLGLIASAGNAMVCLLYLRGRKGNDDLVDRNTYLAQRARNS